MRKVLLAMIVLLALLLPEKGTARDFDAAATQAGIMSADGKVEKQLKGRPWAACAVGDILSTGDKVRTRADSSASLIFTDKTVMRLGAGTTITLIDINEAPDGTLVRKLGQESGRTWSDVTPNPSKPTTFEVHGPNAVAAVKGTAFEVDADSPETDILCWEGQVDCRKPGATAFTRILAGRRFQAGVGANFDREQHLDGFRQWNLQNRTRQQAWFAKLPPRVKLNAAELRGWAAQNNFKLTTNQRQKIQQRRQDRRPGPRGKPPR